MLGAIAGIVFVLGIGFLIARALDATRSDATLPARKIDAGGGRNILARFSYYRSISREIFPCERLLWRRRHLRRLSFLR
jgi:hypothetical protein